VLAAAEGPESDLEGAFLLLQGGEQALAVLLPGGRGPG
jgi:hypothetical protein